MGSIEIGGEVICGHGFRRGGQCRIDVADRFIFARFAVAEEVPIALPLIPCVVPGVVAFMPGDCNFREGGARLPVVVGDHDDASGGRAGGRQRVDALDAPARLDTGIVQ
jgi:hypothetical protein